MKHTFILLGVIAGLLAPLSSHASPTPKPDARLAGQAHRVVVKASKAAPRTIYYITDTTMTGSRIPIVFRRYNGRLQPMDSGFRRDDVLHGSDDGVLQGTPDLGSALRKLEPAFL